MEKIAEIHYLDDYRLSVAFANGTRKTCDITAFLDTGDFVELKDKEIFRQVRNTGFSAEWPNELDLSADTLLSIGT